MPPYRFQLPRGKLIPILISVPHCGTDFPVELKDDFVPSLMQAPDDTDWFVDQLYSFATEMGMPMISAMYSRWVIDLNRDPQNSPLYNDGRIITGLCPTTTFLGESIYRDQRTELRKEEIARRLDEYYSPYHQKIGMVLADLKKQFGKVLLWDCHSIRQFVPTINPERFPDLILGSADEKSASKNLIDIALQTLGSNKYSLAHNSPFKGGHITRTFGKPAENQHALQLEMSKVNYMDDSETRYDKQRASQMQEVFRNTFEKLKNELLAR
jgi:N-formylglutamate deformylase